MYKNLSKKLFTFLALALLSSSAWATNITVSAFDLAGWTGPTTDVEIRLFLSAQLITPEGQTYPATTPASGTTTLKWDCTVTSEVVNSITVYTLHIPQVILPATSNAVGGGRVRYTAVFFRKTPGTQIAPFVNFEFFQIPNQPTTTTWDDIRIYNQGSQGVDYTKPYTRGESLTLLASRVNKTGDTMTGPLTLPGNPSADNQAATRTFVEAEGEEVRSSRFANLGAAATAIGSSETNLLVNKNITCNSAVDWPAQSVIKFTGRGKIVYASGCVLTFKGRGIEASPNRQIFSGFTSSATSPPIKWDTSYPDQFSFIWFGGSISNTGAQNSNAWRLMFDSMSAPIGDGSSTSVVEQGGLVFVPPSTSACYAFDDTAQITKPVIVRGGASAGWYRNTCLSFPKGKTGIYVNGTNTWLSPYTTGPVQSLFSTIENITLIGGGYKHDAPTSSADMTIDTTSGALTMVRNASDTTHTFGQDVAHDSTVTVNRYTYPIASKDSTTQITVHKPRFHVQVQSGASTVRMVSGFAPHTLSGGTPTPTSDWNGQQIVIDSKTYTISSISWDATFLETIINLTTPYSGTTNTVGTDCINSESPCHRGTAVVQSLNTRSAQTLYLNNAHGIDAKAQVRITNFHVRYFAGNGVHISTSTMPLGAANCGGCVNQNNSYVERGMIYNTAGHGIAVFGQETNSIRVQSVDVSVVKGACFLLGSFLGSIYDTTHCAVSEHAPYFNPFGGGAAGSNRIINSYVEGSTPSSYLSQGDKLTETGGEIDQDSAGSYSNTVSSFTNMNRFQISREFPYYNPGILLRFGNVGNNGSTPTTPTIQHALTLGTTEDPDNIPAGGTTQRAAPLVYFSYFPTATGLDGWWGLTHGGLAAYTSLAIASGKAEINYLDTEKITGQNARSQVWFPRGLWLGPARHSMRRILSDNAAPASGQYFQGEVTFNQGVTVGGNAGWIATAKGTPGPGTWNTFGWVYSGVSGSGTHQLGSTIASPATTDYLGWDGSKWINRTPIFSATSGSIGGNALAAGQCESATVTVTGATTGMATVASAVTDPGDDYYIKARVSAADTVVVKVCSVLGGTPTASLYQVRVIR